MVGIFHFNHFVIFLDFFNGPEAFFVYETKMNDDFSEN